MLIPGSGYPDDLDTTSLALMVLRPHNDVVTSVLDEMLKYLNEDGTVQVSHTKRSDTFSLCEIRTIDNPDTSLKHITTCRHTLIARDLEPTLLSAQTC